ncbi:MAG: GNAT family N-acetyltransferase [Defluviicoccus sp.]|nr:GNAT family N-acetyltransferase [Defluviicoccus sp.]MDE0277531.1 GNAT family N-acetyltransferase [Defluviicoccus sp.]
MSPTAPEPIAAHHVLAGLDSGQPTLDNWLTARALRNERDGASRTYVVCDDGAVVAYYCLAAGAVQHRDVPGRFRRNMPDPIPVMLMGRLAVAGSHQGKGIARGLVRDAILRTLKAAEIAGIRALLVHALDEDAATFYRHLGFLESPVDPLVLALPVAMARKLLDP